MRKDEEVGLALDELEAVLLHDLDLGRGQPAGDEPADPEQIQGRPAPCAFRGRAHAGHHLRHHRRRAAAADREPPNLIGRGLLEDETGEPITFFEWFLTALAIVLVMFAALLAVILFLNRPEVKRVEGAEEFIAEEKRKLGPVSAGERNTLIAFGVAIVLWTLPGLVGLFLGDDSSLYESLTDRWLDEGVVAIIAAVQVDPTIPALAAIFGAN
jgi:Sodium:sulfate symporter transmembrane region